MWTAPNYDPLAFSILSFIYLRLQIKNVVCLDHGILGITPDTSEAESGK